MRHVIAAAALVAALALIALYYSGSDTPYGPPHNTAWNGYSMAARTCLRPVYYPDYNADSIFIIPMNP